MTTDLKFLKFEISTRCMCNVAPLVPAYRRTLGICLVFKGG
jgi:hypothetical protein